MANTFFQFRQFIIHQDRCAMKVCTDACIFGAWVGKNTDTKIENVLDIGSGTGLLMMMLAQKSNCSIEGIEIDDEAYGQLQENISQNTWKDRLKAWHGDIRNFNFQQKFDAIISNPPFYENDLLSGTETNRLARHSSMLRLEELMTAITNNLAENGTFSILLPFHRKEYFIELAGINRFFPLRITGVKHSEKHNPFRVMMQFSSSPGSLVKEDELIIRDQDNNYTDSFRELLSAYYLSL